MTNKPIKVIKRPKLSYYYSGQRIVPSFTDPKVEYTVSKRISDGGYECSCWDWRRRRLDCKHIDLAKKPIVQFVTVVHRVEVPGL